MALASQPLSSTRCVRGGVAPTPMGQRTPETGPERAARLRTIAERDR